MSKTDLCIAVLFSCHYFMLKFVFEKMDSWIHAWIFLQTGQKENSRHSSTVMLRQLGLMERFFSEGNRYFLNS